MLLQVPKKKSIQANKENDLSITEAELDKLLDPSAVDQEVHNMIHKGVAPSQVNEIKASFQVTADIVDAVNWQDRVREDLEEESKKDIENTKPWIKDLLEDLIAFDIAPSNSNEEAHTILNHLLEELINMEESGFGPEARNYVFKLRRELELIINKLS